MQPMTLDAALVLSPGNKAYREMEDETLIVVVMQHEDYNGYALPALRSHYQVKDGVCTAYKGLMGGEAQVWLPLEMLYMIEVRESEGEDV